jgi:hypothetical protein
MEITNEERDLLIKHIGSIVSKANILITEPLSPRARIAKTEQILDKALECFDIIKHKKQ